jgi:hypothetical protein
MKELDEIATINKLTSDIGKKAVKESAGCTRSYLALDFEAYRAYRERETKIPPKPYCDNPVDRVVMETFRVRMSCVLQRAAANSRLCIHFSALR